MGDSKDEGALEHMQKNINGLEYEMLPETTVAVSRTFKRQFFQRQQYAPNEEGVCDWNTGAEFVNPRRSWLRFTVTAAGGTAATQGINSLGRGSAMNFISRIVITTRSGVELSRTENFNILAAKLTRYFCPPDYLAANGQAFGYVSDGALLAQAMGGFIGDATSPFPNGPKTFAIPLWMLSGFFQGDGKSLIPPQLAAGLRVQLTFAPFAQAVAGVTGSVVAASTYIISDVSFLINSTSLVDSWQKSINEESAFPGLTYSYTEWHNTQASTPNGETSVQIEVRKACARALYAFVVSKQGADSAIVDNMASMRYRVSSFEWRLGSMYPTQQPISNIPEAYYIAQSTTDGGMVDCSRPNSVTMADFTNGEGLAVNSLGDGIVAVSLERSDIAINGVLNISGLTTNNARVLNVNFTLDLANPVAADAVAIQHNLYMAHLRIVKAFLDNAVISE